MPRGDGTGPMRMGPMTGHAAGYCAGFGRGRGGGRGWRNRFYATGLPGWMRFGEYNAPQQAADPEMEKQILKNQADALQAELSTIQQRLAKLEEKPEQPHSVNDAG